MESTAVLQSVSQSILGWAEWMQLEKMGLEQQIEAQMSSQRPGPIVPHSPLSMTKLRLRIEKT